MKLPALLMAGGEGSRLGAEMEKPLLEFAGRPMVDRVLDALLGSEGISKVFVAVTPNTRETQAHLGERDEEIVMVETPGSGYVEDMSFALEELGLRRALVSSSDLPMLTSADVDYVVVEYEASGGMGSMEVVVPLSLVTQLGFTPNYPRGDFAATGVNVVDRDDPGESTLLTRRINFAANVNVPSDVEAALRLHKV
ncbi:MAG: NTP transferase domain-containing protein [Candidatus Hydrothermarchaeaceae archaeon]